LRQESEAVEGLLHGLESDKVAPWLLAKPAQRRHRLGEIIAILRQELKLHKVPTCIKGCGSCHDAEGNCPGFVA
jgi:hypothetical protein